MLFPLVIWTGLALSPALRFQRSGTCWEGGNQRAHCTFSSPGRSCSSSSVHVAMVASGFRNRMSGNDLGST